MLGFTRERVILGMVWCSGKCGSWWCFAAGSSELLSGFQGFCHGIVGWMRLEGTVGVTLSHPLLVQGPLKHRTQGCAWLMTGWGQGWTRPALLWRWL